MRIKLTYKSLTVLLLASFVLLSFNMHADLDNKPNIIYILADDLGYGDLSCYGQTKFQTPHIDQLAEQGMRFMQHYSGAAVCAPSRSSLMTGLHTGHTPIRGNKEMEGEGQEPLPGKYLTLAELLKEAGYVTGAFGKWGLGYPGSEGDPNNQGFDEFYGYNCQRLAHRYYPPYLWHNQDTIFLEGNDWSNTITYAPDKIQEATLQFIENNADKPFFAFVPLVLPHAELISPDDSLLAKFKGQFKETPHRTGYVSDYGPDIDIKKYCTQDIPCATFASMVVRMDIYVGQIMQKIEELGIADNTIIMFASDNGPHEEGGADPEFFNSSGGLRGIKRDLYEGGIRTPFIVSWPGKVVAGSESNHISAFWDIMPTFANMANVALPVTCDGISFLPELLGMEQQQHQYLYWEFNTRGGHQAVRTGKWKAVKNNIWEGTPGGMELYDLSMDRTEKNNVANMHPHIVERMKEIMDESHANSAMFPFNGVDK